nr:SymE family type I addiction module toxin [Pseudodesulfovibrio sp.]
MIKRNDTPDRRSAKGRKKTSQTICQQRRIKVRSFRYDQPIRDPLHHRGFYYKPMSVPWIQMQGRWLELAGFNIDQMITIRVMEHCLVLTTEPEPEPAT